MARKTKIEIALHNALYNKIAFGESKHAAKQELAFGQSTYKIFSFGTYNTYEKETAQYARWLREEKGINKVKDISETEQYAKEYIQYRLDSGVSVYTAKMERSALAMVYNKPIEIEMPRRDNKSIKRSRLEVKNDKYISRTGKYKDIFTIAAATGCRRKDANKLTVDNFKEIDGKLYVEILQSKGGRDRLAPVVPSAVQEVKDILEKARADGKTKLFTHIPKEIDIHSLRREYSQAIYQAFVDDREFRDAYFKAANIPPRHEYRTFKDTDGNTHTREVKTTIYKDRDGNVWNRDNLYSTSQALGHNRLDVTMVYLKS